MKPEDVFTPRSPQINEGMYVDRPELERQIRNALSGQKNIILYGESGNGKTWLYNRVFQARGVHFEVLNLGFAKLHSDLRPVIRDKLGDFGVIEQTDVRGEVKSGFMPQNVGVQVTNTTTKSMVPKSDLVTLFSNTRQRAGTKPAVIVFDNFEQIVSQDEIIQQISSILILLDDPVLAASNVKIMIVGVPGDIKAMIGKSSNATTISNRVTEIDEVERLSLDQSKELMERGFVSKLKLKFEIDKDLAFQRIAWLTDRIAQHIHELCLTIARQSVEFNNGRVTDDVLAASIEDWLKDSLSSDYTVVEQHMNSRETKTGRKNQTLFALGACDLEDFKNKDIDAVVRAEFPNSTKDTLLDIPGMMSKFSSSDNPLIRRTKKDDAYRFVSPKYRMAIRAILEKGPNEKVRRTTTSNK